MLYQILARLTHSHRPQGLGSFSARQGLAVNACVCKKKHLPGTGGDNAVGDSGVL